MKNTESIKAFIRNLGVDLVGICDLNPLKEMPTGLPISTPMLLNEYRFAIVIGVQWGKLGKEVTGRDVSKFLEGVITDISSFLEKHKVYSLPIHTEDELDPVKRMGLLSLKILAKAAGLGWQGRSLLIVSPEYGPIHRLAAVLTNLNLHADTTVTNQCGNCSICVEECPTRALTLTPFDDHPQSREEVLNLQTCLGDDGCMVCIKKCPFARLAINKNIFKK